MSSIPPILRSINYTTFSKICLTFISLSTPFNLDYSIFQQIHFEFSPLIINTHHRSQSHLFTPLSISTRFISLASNQYPTSNHQSQTPSLSNFHNSRILFSMILASSIPTFKFIPIVDDVIHNLHIQLSLKFIASNDLSINSFPSFSNFLDQ